MGQGRSMRGAWSGDTGWSIVNTHVRLAPGCSAFDTVPDEVTTEHREGVRIIRASNLAASDRYLWAELGADLIDAASPAVAR
jgi:hypothetical protein